MTFRILLVEDDAPQRRTLAGYLRKRGYQVDEAGSAAEAEANARASAIDLLLTDLRLGGPDGITLLTSLRRRHPDLEAIVLTAYGSVEDAVRAMRAGAYDFVAKPVDLDRLEVLVEKALQRVLLAQENRGLRQAVQQGGAFDELIGDCAPMSQVKELAAKVATSRASVLVLGESGTGKEVLARAIHRASPRQARPFVTVNCAALPETLIESELFGYEKGAFTGAVAAKKGRFELADGGTLFLDEVGDIPPAVQVKLLNVLQSGRFERLGGTESLQVDVRLITATHRDLEQHMREGLFREDLYYRLNVVAIAMPPLRERAQDIPALVEHLLRKHADLAGSEAQGVAQSVMQQLMRYPFPGNVRQLENWLERAVVLAEGSLLVAEDFPPQLGEPAVPPGSATNTAAMVNLEQSLEDQVARLETTLITAALTRHNGNKSAAARELGLTERTMRYKVSKYGL